VEPAANGGPQISQTIDANEASDFRSSPLRVFRVMPRPSNARLVTLTLKSLDCRGIRCPEFARRKMFAAHAFP
jgi:hypothetical protein